MSETVTSPRPAPPSSGAERRRIEKRTSQTAEWLCVARACSYRDRSPYGHSEDWVAARLLNPVLRTASRFARFRRFWGRLSRKGMYEWAVARTRYVDAVFEKYASSVAQVLIMGAGYDTRGVRFEDRLRDARVFEVDAPTTQADKLRGFRLRKIPLPANLTFVAVNFDHETAAERLAEAGFRNGLPTLYLLEGLTMYLAPESVDETLRLISDSAGSGSILVFDYAYADVLRGDTSRFGAEGVMKAVSEAGESWRFGIEEGGIAEFLSRYGFQVVDEASPAELERRFYTDPDGVCHGRVNGTQAVVTARKP